MTQVVRRHIWIVLAVWSLAAAAWSANANDLADEDIVRGPLGQKIHEQTTQRERGGFSGALLVAKDGKVIIAKGYGLANREKRIPFTSNTVFDIGSITKQFTGAAIARLEMQGRLSADDPLSKYFPQAPPDKAKITLYQLLTHSAGFKSDFGDDYDPLSREKFVETALESKLLFPPGQGHRYANSGFSLLAAIIEQVANQPYEAHLRENLWLPVGMEHTGYRLPNWDANTIAHGYRGQEDWGTPLDKAWAEDGPYWNLRGNGGVLSTVWDLYRWHRALLGDDVLSHETKKKLFDRRVKEGPAAKSWYSYGWSLSDSPRGTRIIEHNGGNGIFYADFIRYVDDDVVVIAATNLSQDAGGGYMRSIRRLIFQ